MATLTLPAYQAKRIQTKPLPGAISAPRLHSEPQYIAPGAFVRLPLQSVPAAASSGLTPVTHDPLSAVLPGHQADALTTDYRGPDPYVDYDRRFTPEDGIAITYKTTDENGWRTALRTIVLLAMIALAVTYAVKGSPYPMIPRGCPVFGPCPFPMRWDRYWVDLALLTCLSALSAWILFAEVQVYREIEIRADCMILDGDGIFWAEKFELGWPQFVPGEDGMQVLAGVYGTRWTEFLKVKAFDEFDRGPAVFAAHLAAAMQQQWGQPGQNA